MSTRIVPVAVLAIGSCLSAQVAAGVSQAPAEGRLDLREIAERLPGDYDNEPQRFFLEGMKRGDAAPARRHLTIRDGGATAAAPGAVAEVLLNIEDRDGDERAPVARRAEWALSVDPATNLVRMQVRGRDGSAGNCTVSWRRRAGVFVGTPDASCSGTMIAPGTLWLADGELWDERLGAAEPTKLLKSQPYECFVAVRLTDGQSQAFTKLQTHDRGGTIEVATKDSPARKFTLLLRRGLWPSVSGNNFVELLTIYLYEEGHKNVVGSGWATPDSGRVGFGIGDELPGGQQASARCKRASLPGGT